MKREDFISTVGYSGNTAIVDGKTRKRYGSLSASELVASGAYRAAFCAALYDQDQTGFDQVLAAYNGQHGTNYRQADELKRVFGVDSVPTEVIRIKVL
jgi:hypothetical protein